MPATSAPTSCQHTGQVRAWHRVAPGTTDCALWRKDYMRGRGRERQQRTPVRSRVHFLLAGTGRPYLQQSHGTSHSGQSHGAHPRRRLRGREVFSGTPQSPTLASGLPTQHGQGGTEQVPHPRTATYHRRRQAHGSDHTRPCRHEDLHRKKQD